MSQAELGKLPDGWRWVRLGDVCQQDRQIIEASSEQAKRLLYLSLEHIESQTGKILRNPESSIEDEGKSTTFAFDSRHVLYGKLRPYLNKVALPNFEGRCTTEAIPLIPDSRTDRHFIAWILRRKETVDAAMKDKTGSRMPRANMDVLLNLEIPVPPLPEQKRIASFLNEQMAAVEKARAAAEAQCEAAKTLPRAYLRKVFKYRVGDKLPEGWRWVRLGDACKEKTATRDPRLQPAETFRYVDISSVDNNQKCILDTGVLLGKDAPSRARQVINAGDIVVSTTRPNLNAVAVVPQELDAQICSTGFCVLRPKKELDCDYLFAYVCSPDFVKKLSDLVKGALYPAVTDKQVKAQVIPLPNLPEQKRITAILNKQMAEAERLGKSVDEQLNTIKSLPSALLHQAFSGAL